MKVHNKKSLLGIRRDLRKNSTETEKILWEYLRSNKLEVKFKRQHSIGNYIVDFYCASKQLIIELDGAVYKEKDEERDKNLEEIIFSVFEIL